MKRSSRITLSRTGLVGLVALVALAGETLVAAVPEGKSCADCCMLPCIEAQLWEAGYMRNRYGALSKTKGLTSEQYLAREEEFRTVAQAMRSMYTGQNPTCNWYLPPDEMESRRLFNDYGYKTTWTGGSITEIQFNLKVDPAKCELTRPQARDLMPKVNTCRGMGDAVVAHEDKHIKECEQRRDAAAKKGRAPAPLTPAENAAAEVRGYDAEIAQLEKSRREAAAPCMKDSCRSKSSFDRTARGFGTDIRKLLGLSKKKAPSNSPLRRGARKG
jgi:hypothetical protein